MGNIVNDGINPADFCTPANAAEYIGVTRQRIHQYVVDGKLDSIKIGSARLIEKNSLEVLKGAERKAGRPNA